MKRVVWLVIVLLASPVSLFAADCGCGPSVAPSAVPAEKGCKPYEADAARVRHAIKLLEAAPDADFYKPPLDAARDGLLLRILEAQRTNNPDLYRCCEVVALERIAFVSSYVVKGLQMYEGTPAVPSTVDGMVSLETASSAAMVLAWGKLPARDVWFSHALERRLEFAERWRGDRDAVILTEALAGEACWVHQWVCLERSDSWSLPAVERQALAEMVAWAQRLHATFRAKRIVGIEDAWQKWDQDTARRLQGQSRLDVTAFLEWRKHFYMLLCEEQKKKFRAGSLEAQAEEWLHWREIPVYLYKGNPVTVHQPPECARALEVLRWLKHKLEPPCESDKCGRCTTCVPCLPCMPKALVPVPKLPCHPEPCEPRLSPGPCL